MIYWQFVTVLASAQPITLLYMLCKRVDTRKVCYVITSVIFLR